MWHVRLQGQGATYSLPSWEGPGIWNYTQAVEADSQFFYSGVPWDMVRDHSNVLTPAPEHHLAVWMRHADIIAYCHTSHWQGSSCSSQGRCCKPKHRVLSEMSLGQGFSSAQVARNYTAQTLMLANASLGPVTQYDVITVSAMEGVGVAAAMEKQQQTSGERTSPLSGHEQLMPLLLPEQPDSAAHLVLAP